MRLTFVFCATLAACAPRTVGDATPPEQGPAATVPADSAPPHAEPAPATPVEATSELMGTHWAIRVLVPAGRDTEAARHAIDSAFTEIARIESVMSEWRPETPISAVNAGAGGPPVDVPAELVAIVRRAVALAEASGGAFDPTWRAMDALWPVHRGDFRVPEATAVEQARVLVDYRAVATTDTTVALGRAGMALGLGGIAKGYAIDRAGATLRDAGFTSFYVDGGGDVLVGGGRDGEPWRVGIRAPRGGRTDLVGMLGVRDGAIATSGDYERARIVDGRRYSHIIDPRTGYPAEGSWSVTVLAPTAEQADGLATAVFVLGADRGLALVGTVDDVEAFVVDDDGVEHMTDGFRALFVHR